MCLIIFPAFSALATTVDGMFAPHFETAYSSNAKSNK